ncbi:MAG: hypothetical protein JWM32_1478 [Verrucomicrobia bacterium]|nr:hypothetical protein [Verrucomicrobiota bacterium]
MKATTTTSSLPAAVTGYVEAANRFEAAEAAEHFTADATVHDENHDYVGRDAIRAWIAETSRKYRPGFTVMRSSVTGDAVNLAVAVSGQFPGSPVTLDYDLRLRDGKISTLEIT